MLIYIAGLVLAVVPLMFAEFAIGRRGGAALQALLRWITPALIAAVALAPAFAG